MESFRRHGKTAAVGLLAAGLSACLHPAPKPLPVAAATAISEASRIRLGRLDAISAKRDLPVPREFRRILQAGIRADWPAVSNAYARVWPRSHQYENTRPDPRITTELWNPVHETYWIAHSLVEDWPPAWARSYAETLFETLPSNAIVFAGTDPSRFVAAPLAENGLRPDLFFLSLNALADGLYMDYAEDLYADRLWIPNPEQRNAAFKRLVDELKTGRYATPFIQIDDGRIEIPGIEGIGEINAVLAEEILRNNHPRHRVFLDEGYSHPRLRPHLKPHGPLLEFHPNPIESISPEEVAADMAYWNQLETNLFASAGFAESVSPRLTYAVLRAAGARLYAARYMADAAEKAFQQAMRIAPHVCNVHYDYAMLYLIPRGETDKARNVLDRLIERYPDHQAFRDVRDRLEPSSEGR